MSFVALVLIRFGGSSLAFYKDHIELFRSVLPHSGSKLNGIFFFLDSLFFEESVGKVSEFFSISWTNWEQVLLGNPIL